MRSTFLPRRLLVALCAAATMLFQADDTLAQVGVLNPNPTMPSDVPLGSGAYGSSGGIGIGRGPTPPGPGREKNPAKTMLKSLEGTNYGRYRGRVLYSPDSANSAGSAPVQSDPSSAEAPRAARRGQLVVTMPAGGRPENRWRYQFSQGRWWYEMDGGRWSYFNGSRWVPYQQTRRGVSSARNLRAAGERQ